MPKLSRLSRKLWAKLQLFQMRVETKIIGEEDPSAQLFLINHRSVLDIIALEAYSNLDTCWIGKQEITNIPIFGHLMKAPKMISIDRNDKKGLIAMLSDVKNRLDNNRVIMIFPEGTRSSTQELLPFQSGAQLIGNKCNLTVQPVVIHGSDIILDTKNKVVHKGKLLIEYLPSFKASKETKWLEKAREAMQETYTRLHNGI